MTKKSDGQGSHISNNWVWQQLVYTLVLGQQIMSPDEIRTAVSAILSKVDDLDVEVSSFGVEAPIAVAGCLKSTAVQCDQAGVELRIRLRQLCIDAVDENIWLVDELLSFRDDDHNSILPKYLWRGVKAPVTVAFWRTACANMLLRDIARLRALFDRIDESPAGSYMLAQVPFSVDRRLVARLLGFRHAVSNALDAIVGRDYIAETVSVTTGGIATINRITEDVAHWYGAERGVCYFNDNFQFSPACSSALDHLLAMSKQIPLTYSSDFSEEGVISTSAVESYLTELRTAATWLRKLSFDKDRGEQLSWEDFSTAPALTHHLVNRHGVPFVGASEITDKVVSALRDGKRVLHDTTAVAEILSTLGHEVEPDMLYRVLSPCAVAAGHVNAGDALSVCTSKLWSDATDTLGDHLAWVQHQQGQLNQARNAVFEAAMKVAEGVDISQTLLTAVGGLC